MKMRQSVSWVLVLLLVWCVLPAAAGPGAFALLKVERGQAEVDNKKVHNGVIVREGQHLSLTDKDVVTLKMLGTSKEVTLNGPYSQVLKKSALDKSAVSLKRAELTVSLNTLKGNTVGGGVERKTVDPQRPEVKLLLPLRLESSEFELRVVEFAPYLGDMKDYSHEIQLLDMDEELSPILFSEHQKDALTPTVFRAALLEPGHNYALRVETTNNVAESPERGLTTAVQVPIRIPTADEQALLDSYRGRTGLDALMERAELAEALAQHQEVVEVLRLLRASDLTRYPLLRQGVEKELAYYGRLLQIR